LCPRAYLRVPDHGDPHLLPCCGYLPWRSRGLNTDSGLLARSFLPTGGLRGLRWRGLHSPSARCRHSHSLGGSGGGSQWRRARIYAPLKGGSVHWQWFLARSARNGCKCVGWKTLRVSASICKSTTAPPTAEWISLQMADSVAAPESSTSTSRRASSRGLGYFYSISRVATRLTSNSGHILQNYPSIREEVLDSRLGGSVPRVLRFFLLILRDILAKTSDGPSARVYNST
jgi:hypothetical protein